MQNLIFIVNWSKLEFIANWLDVLGSDVGLLGFVVDSVISEGI